MQYKNQVDQLWPTSPCLLRASHVAGWKAEVNARAQSSLRIAPLSQSFVYPALSPATQSSLRALLLSAASAPALPRSVSRKLSDAVAELASFLLPADAWPDLLSFPSLQPWGLRNLQHGGDHAGQLAAQEPRLRAGELDAAPFRAPMDPQAEAGAAAAVLGADPAALTALLADLTSPANEARSRAEQQFHALHGSYPDALALSLAHLLLSPAHPSAAIAAVQLRRRRHHHLIGGTPAWADLPGRPRDPPCNPSARGGIGASRPERVGAALRARWQAEAEESIRTQDYRNYQCLPNAVRLVSSHLVSRVDSIS